MDTPHRLVPVTGNALLRMNRMTGPSALCWISDLQVYVTIDGQDVGYAKIFYATYKTSEGAFEGFLHSRGDQQGGSCPCKFISFNTESILDC